MVSGLRSLKPTGTPTSIHIYTYIMWLFSLLVALPSALPVTLPLTLPSALPLTLPSVLPLTVPSALPSTLPLTLPFDVAFDTAFDAAVFTGWGGAGRGMFSKDEDATMEVANVRVDAYEDQTALEPEQANALAKKAIRDPPLNHIHTPPPPPPAPPPHGS